MTIFLIPGFLQDDNLLHPYTTTSLWECLWWQKWSVKFARRYGRSYMTLSCLSQVKRCGKGLSRNFGRSCRFPIASKPLVANTSGWKAAQVRNFVFKKILFSIILLPLSNAHLRLTSEPIAANVMPESSENLWRGVAFIKEISRFPQAGLSHAQHCRVLCWSL